MATIDDLEIMSITQIPFNDILVRIKDIRSARRAATVKKSQMRKSSSVKKQKEKVTAETLASQMSLESLTRLISSLEAKLK